MKLPRVSRFWLWFSLVMIGYSGGIVTGVVVDVDQVYHTTVKKLKQKNSPGGEIIVDVDTGEEVKSKKEIRAEKKEERQRNRAMKKAKRKMKRGDTNNEVDNSG